MPVCDSFSESCFGTITQMPALRIGSDDQSKFEPIELAEQSDTPLLRAFAPRRKIGPLGISPGKTKTHGNDRDPRGVVELFRRHAHPGAQPIPRWIGEGCTRLMHACARRLPEDREPRGAADAKDRPRFMWQWFSVRGVSADAAIANFSGKPIERGSATTIRVRA